LEVPRDRSESFDGHPLLSEDAVDVFQQVLSSVMGQLDHVSDAIEQVSQDFFSHVPVTITFGEFFD